MTSKKQSVIIPDEMLMSRILLVRGKKVMLDRDLAELYGVTTTRLNEQVKRNLKRFPKDFMFQVNEREKQDLIDNYEYLKGLRFSPHKPFVFTEHGAVMLASVLNSKRAIDANIQIVRIFTRMREVLSTNQHIISKLDVLEQQVIHNNSDIQELFNALRHLLNTDTTKRKKIGFRRASEKDRDD